MVFSYIVVGDDEFDLNGTAADLPAYEAMLAHGLDKTRVWQSLMAADDRAASAERCDRPTGRMFWGVSAETLGSMLGDHLARLAFMALTASRADGDQALQASAEDYARAKAFFRCEAH